MNDIPCGNNEARGPRKLKHILKVPFAFQPASLFFDDNAVAAMVLLPKRLLPEDGPRQLEKGFLPLDFIMMIGAVLDWILEYDKNICRR